MPPMKPLLVFGLRGTLVERLHFRNVPDTMPAPDFTVGMFKVWLRPHMIQVLTELQTHCRIALWSSTTARNTHPLVSAVFEVPATPPVVPSAAAAPPRSGFAATSATADSATPAPGGGRQGRFDKKKRPPTAAEAAEATAASGVSVATPSPVHFEFIWTREHTTVDDFRRLNASVVDDSHATMKDLSRVFEQFPSIAQPHNTVLIDDTPSKGKAHADNFLWLDSCGALRISDKDALHRLRDFVVEELVHAKDVRELLPHRIRA